MAFYKCGRIYTTSNSRVDIDTKSGSVARFNTSLAMPVLSCTAEFSASQAEGTPTPASPIPIIGVDKVNITRTGKNLFDKSKMVISTQRFVKYGVDAYNDTLPNGEFNLKANQAYTFMFSGENSTNFESFGVYNEEGTRVAIVYNNKKTTFTPASTGAYFLAFAVSAGNWGGTWDNYDIQLEFGSTATEYEPYQGTTAIINLGGTYFGGSVDAVTGRIPLSKDVINFTGSENWSYHSSGFFYTTTTIDNYKANNAVVASNGIKIRLVVGGTYAVIRIYVSDNTDYIDAQTDMQTIMTNGTQALYELAEPIVVYASNTAELYTKAGLNNVFCDTGDIEVKYRKLHSDN